jgi:hypothetical protein
MTDPDKAFAYVTFAAQVIRMAQTESDLNRWWIEEADHREAYGVVKGTPEWKAVVECCADRKAAIILNPKGKAA